MNQLNRNLIRKFFDEFIYFDKNHCAEVRCLKAKTDSTTKRIYRSDKDTVVGGWFTNADELLCELSRIHNVSSYITFNPVSIGNRPISAKNNLRILKKGEFCTDQDISIWRYFIIDIDPVKRDPISRDQNSTNQELLDCILLRNHIIEDMDITDNCVPGISGNGAFILVRLPDYPNDEDSAKTIFHLISMISKRYSNELCEVDTQTKNPSRLVAIPGTWKYRDVISTTDRPHRQVDIVLADMDNSPCLSHSTPRSG